MNEFMRCLGWFGVVFDKPDDKSGGVGKPKDGDLQDGDPVDDSEGEESKPDDSGGDDDVPEWVSDPNKALAEIRKLREENKKHRLDKKERDRQAESEQLEQGKFKQLYEGLKPKYDDLERNQEQFEQYRTFVQTLYEQRMEKVPQHIKDLLADKDPLSALTWVENNADQLAPPDPTDLDPGKKSDDKKDPYTGSIEHQREIARRFGLPVPTNKKQ